MGHFRRQHVCGGWQGRPESLSVWAKGRLLLFGVRMARPRSSATPAGLLLPFETHTVRGKAGGLDAWYIPNEDARGVVLIFQGFGSCNS